MIIRSFARHALALTWLATGGLIAAGALTGCGQDDYSPPDSPAHDDSQGGAMHASGKSTPYLCMDPDSGDRVSCPTDYRPEDEHLSCDASGCHGSYEFALDQSWDERALDGSAGPSCHTCHGTRWSERM